MAKKFVRGITDINEINKQDFDTNNINDLLSDGEHNYIHRKKKDNSEEYHNLTNNLKTITSDNTDLLSVTNYNNSTNSATLHPKHDPQKEQAIESTRNTITIEHGENGTSWTTKVDTNPQIVLEHSNLLSDYGISKKSSGNTTELGIEYTEVPSTFDINNLTNGYIKGYNLTNAPDAKWYFVSTFGDENYGIQDAKSLFAPNTTFTRTRENGVWQQWREQLGDKSVIDEMLAQKQNTLVTNTSMAILPNGQLRQLFAFKSTYSHTNGLMKTHIKSVAENTNVNTPLIEYNFIVKINKGSSSVNFTLNDYDTTQFSAIMSNYGENNSVRISGCVFTLSGSTLTVSTGNNTEQNYVITFSDII